MKIIVDTCNWLMAFRRKTEMINQAAVRDPRSFILDGMAQMIGPTARSFIGYKIAGPV
jgi:hypothetical protein